MPSLKILITSLLIFFSLMVTAQREYNVLDWKTDVTLNTYLVQQMHKEYDARRIEFAKAITSKNAAESYIASVQSQIDALYGNFPARTPLNPQVTATIQRQGYSIQKIIYESFPQHHVTANLYIPAGEGPFPAALLFCGHEDVSKASASYQQTAILFARNGFVVFVIDPVSQSERYQLTDVNGKPLTRGGTTEHTLLNESSNLVGESTPVDELWDNIRGLDYLVTRKEVDTARIGCLGSSGGGMQTIYFAAAESRIKVIAPCSFLMNRERALEMTGPSDGCSQIPMEGGLMLEMSDFLIAAAPRPVLVLAGRFDFIDYTGTLQAYDEIKKIYTVIGEPAKTQLFTYADGHGISKPKREAAVTWFRKWLYNDSTPVKEKEEEVLTDKELFATKSGQVNSEFPGEVNLVARNINLYNQAAVARKSFITANNQAIRLEAMKFAIGIFDPVRTIEVEEKQSLTKNNLVFHKLIIRKENEIPLPALVVYPASMIEKTIVWLYDAGKNKIADSVDLLRSYLKQNAAVILADVRGIGETEDKPELNDPKYYNKEYRNAMLALHFGSSLVGQRMIDVLTVMDYIRSNPQLALKPVEMNASGVVGISALHAMFFDKDIARLNLYHSIHSFKEILEKPLEKNWYSYIIRGVLWSYDIPDLVNLVGANKISFKD